MCIDYSEYMGYEGVGVVLYSMNQRLVGLVETLQATATSMARRATWRSIDGSRKWLELLLLGPHRKAHGPKAIRYLGAVSERIRREPSRAGVVAVYALTPRVNRISSLVNYVTAMGLEGLIILHEYVQGEVAERKVIGSIIRELRRSGIVELRQITGKNYMVSLCDMAARYAAIRSAIVVAESKMKEEVPEPLIPLNKLKKEAKRLRELLNSISRENLIELLP
ncbi:hypothetical protein [Pyrodictium abyssi]|uniref:KaiC-like domain-containing protein n=1 Tax=Pyrodictium abyssi TaxID=54256 RepID=A0ABM8IVW7_9CREN|nr:hypothetical protein PABY_12590 [Pyrodictium abyssi]